MCNGGCHMQAEDAHGYKATRLAVGLGGLVALHFCREALVDHTRRMLAEHEQANPGAVPSVDKMQSHYQSTRTRLNQYQVCPAGSRHRNRWLCWLYWLRGLQASHPLAPDSAPKL